MSEYLPSEKLRAAFHVKDGIWFEVLTDGYVRVAKTDGEAPHRGGNEEWTFFMEENVWASVVTSLSHEGETFDSWQEARMRHLGANRYLLKIKGDG